jgi:CheY-like chemotaxis protein
MPRKDGLRTAKEILGARPHQRIVFASAFVRETLLESVKELDQVVELLQKPFEIDVLVDTVEDKTIYEELKRLNVDIQKLKNWNPTHSQVRDLLDGLMRIRKPGSSFCSLLSAAADNKSDGTSPLKSPR